MMDARNWGTGSELSHEDIAIAYRIRTSFGFHTTAIIPLTLNPSPWGRGTFKKSSGSPLPLGEGLGVRDDGACLNQTGNCYIAKTADTDRA